MAITSIKMTGSGAAATTTNGVAAIDIPEDGDIVGADWTLWSDAFAGVDTLIRAELSFIASNQFDTNDARGAISEAAARFDVVTSGGGTLQANKAVQFNPGIEVAAGERLYVHTTGAGAGQTIDFAVMIHLNTRKRIQRRSRRRR